MFYCSCDVYLPATDGLTNMRGKRLRFSGSERINVLEKQRSLPGYVGE